MKGHNHPVENYTALAAAVGNLDRTESVSNCSLSADPVAGAVGTTFAAADTTSSVAAVVGVGIGIS